MGIADLLDETVDIYKTNFVLLIGIAAVVYIPYSILQGLLQPAHIKIDPNHLAAAFVPIIIELIFALTIEPLVTGALALAVSERYLGRPTSIGACYRFMLRPSVFFRFLGAVAIQLALVIGLCGAMMATTVGGAIAFAMAHRQAGTLGLFLIAAGFLLLVAALGIAVVYVLLRLCLLAPALIVEGKGSGGAISRSWRLTRGSALKALGLFFIAITLVTVISAVVVGPTQAIMFFDVSKGAMIPQAIVVVNVLVSTLVNTLLMPITSIVAILLYYDIRIRKEGFDLEMLAGDLDAKTREFNSGGASALPQEKPPTDDQ